MEKHVAKDLADPDLLHRRSPRDGPLDHRPDLDPIPAPRRRGEEAGERLPCPRERMPRGIARQGDAGLDRSRLGDVGPDLDGNGPAGAVVSLHHRPLQRSDDPQSRPPGHRRGAMGQQGRDDEGPKQGEPRPQPESGPTPSRP